MNRMLKSSVLEPMVYPHAHLSPPDKEGRLGDHGNLAPHALSSIGPRLKVAIRGIVPHAIPRGSVSQIFIDCEHYLIRLHDPCEERK
jgi:hypothetical protein